MTHPLDQWAAGSHDAQAVVHLLARAFDGVLAAPGRPWVITHDGWTALNDDALGHAAVAAHSESERRILAAAHSLLTGAPVDLRWVTTNLDRTSATALVEAVAIAAGLAEIADLLLQQGATKPHAATAVGSRPDERRPPGRE